MQKSLTREVQEDGTYIIYASDELGNPTGEITHTVTKDQMTKERHIIRDGVEVVQLIRGDGSVAFEWETL